MNISLSPFGPENMISRYGFGRPVPRQPAHSPYWGLFTGFLPISAAASIYFLDRRTPSGESRVHRVTQLCTEGIHCRESAGKGQEALKVVPATGTALAGHHRPINMRFSFPHPLLVGSWHIGTFGYSDVWINRVRLPILLVVS